jgi:hypothetical protein
MSRIQKLSIIGLVLLAALAGCGMADPILPEEPSVETHGEASTAAEPAEAALPEGIPAGVLTADIEAETVRMYDREGSFVGEATIPNFGGDNPDSLHVTGRWDGSNIPDLVYRVWSPSQAIMRFANGSASKLRDTASYLAMAGAPGEAAFAFSEAEFKDTGIQSYLYAVTLDNAGSASFILEQFEGSQDVMNMPMKPVGLTTVAGQPQGVWYTKTAWGIGGVDLIFPINRGLYFYDLTNGDNTQAIDPQRNFQGISPDLGFAASKAFDMLGDQSLSVHNLGNGASVNFVLHPASDRGAGWAVFSPDNRFAAWMEGEGSLVSEPPAFIARVRIGEIASGGVVQEMDSAAAATTMGWSRVSMMKPVGWLDDMNVLVEARGENWSDVGLLKFNAQNGQISSFCPGGFAGFMYP